MSSFEKLKEELAELRIWRNYAVTVIIALVAYLATQYGAAGITVLSLAFVVALVLVIATFYLNKEVQKKLNEFDES